MTEMIAFEYQLSEVARLATLLSHQIVDTKSMRREVPHQHIAALVKAAELLQDHDIIWPPVVVEALIELAD